MDPSPFPLNVPFRPSPKFRLWYAITTLLGVLFAAVAFGSLALLVVLPAVAYVAFVVFAVVLVAIFLVWMLLYYASMEYELRDDELSWRRGVWFRRTGIVPYNRITNIDIRQGPVMRALGISNLAIQTAGYSGQATAEIVLEAMEHAEDLRAAVRARVRGAAGGDGTGSGPSVPAPSPADTGLQILEELRRVRALLEERR
ncbi:MAG: PH domain-containing protein [Methanospirillum sp.]